MVAQDSKKNFLEGVVWTRKDPTKIMKASMVVVMLEEVDNNRKEHSMAMKKMKTMIKTKKKTRDCKDIKDRKKEVNKMKMKMRMIIQLIHREEVVVEEIHTRRINTFTEESMIHSMKMTLMHPASKDQTTLSKRLPMEI